MSAEAVGWVFRHSPLKGVAFAIHLAVADSVNDQHEHRFWMRQAVLAVKARTTRATVNTALAAMVNADGEHPWDPLVELLAEHRGGANEYRFLYPDVGVVYETRTRGVSTQTTPSGKAGVSSQPTGGVTAADTGVEREPTHNPKVNPTNPTPTGGPPVELSVAEQREVTAREVTAEVWEARDPKPAQPFVAVVGVAVRLLAAGWERDKVRDAMVAVPTISTGWCEGWLNDARGRGRPAPGRAVTTDRAAPTGRVR